MRSGYGVEEYQYPNREGYRFTWVLAGELRGIAEPTFSTDAKDLSAESVVV